MCMNLWSFSATQRTTHASSSGGKSKDVIGAAAMMRRAMRVVFTLGLAFATGGSFGESTEGTSTRFGVGAVGILGIAGGRMCGKSRTRIFPRTEVITLKAARQDLADDRRLSLTTATHRGRRA